MRQRFTPSSSFGAGTIVLALLVAIPACHNADDPPSIPDAVSIVRLDDLEVPALMLDFTVEPDDEILDLWALASQPCNLESGWSNPLPKGAPGSSSGSVLDLFVEQARWTHLAVRLKGLTVWTERAKIEISLNGRSLGTDPLSARWQHVSYSLPPDLLKPGVNRIDFVVTSDEPGAPAPRAKRRSKNAFQLQKLALVELPESTTLSARELRTIMDGQTAQIPSAPDGSPDSASRRSGVSKPAGQTADEVQDGPPDIVVIILDAARPDHFSCYGYDRPTSPAIDRLATESLVFQNAFALVPNTRRSVPTMVTGLSFVNHQVVTDGSVLSDQATTLAEALQEVGYRTACFTATPNNSRSLGTDQGFEEFFEVWRDAPIDTSMDPHFLANRVLDWLDGTDGSELIHLQLHFVPPHAPYTPAAAFDVFSDPAYDGPFDGFPKHIVKSETGWRPPSDEDLAHMINRYDGNLLAADDAVGSILSGLMKRPRWNNTVVLVTSDHGEAFFEHRYLGHNNTVYDEMLRVPFILRLPPKIDHDAVDCDRLVTLADITPTMLAAANLRLEAPTDGIDLLAPRTVGRAPDDRTFVGRTAHERPSRCLRTSRWKIVLTRQGRGELYDMVADPAEQHNLRFAEPALFLRLGADLVESFLAEPVLPATIRDSDVSQTDREMLEALGYVN